MVGCIPDVLMLLLRPILKYLCLSYARCHVCQICHILHISLPKLSRSGSTNYFFKISIQLFILKATTKKYRQYLKIIFWFDDTSYWSVWSFFNTIKHTQIFWTPPLDEQFSRGVNKGVPDLFSQFFQNDCIFVCIKATFETQNKLKT